MDCYEVIKTRRSVRAYTSDPIPEDVLHRVLDATRLAPSGRNLQPTRLVLVRDPDRRKDLIPLCNNQKFIAEAPVIIVACGVELPFNRGGYMGRLSMLVEVGIAVDHLTLAARAEGLGIACAIGFAERPERMVLLLLLLLFGFAASGWFLLILALLTWWTVYQRVSHVARELGRDEADES